MSFSREKPGDHSWTSYISIISLEVTECFHLCFPGRNNVYSWVSVTASSYCQGLIVIYNVVCAENLKKQKQKKKTLKLNTASGELLCHELFQISSTNFTMFLKSVDTLLLISFVTADDKCNPKWSEEYLIQTLWSFS